MKKYNQLNLERRYKIECLLDQGFNQTEIARALNVNKSTISREFKRNIGSRGRNAGYYSAEISERKAKIREKEKRKATKLTTKFKNYFRKKLKIEKWSPEIISVEGKKKFGDFVSHETIYKYIWIAKKSNRREFKKDKKLYLYLRHVKRSQKRSNERRRRGVIPNRTPMEKRAKIIEKRKRIGDLEVDLMMGAAHRPALIVITDRTTLETELIKIYSKKAEIIQAKIRTRLKKRKSEIKTLTFDNDLAFARHEKIAKDLNVKTYFTRPYTSQDKGSVENRIGVVRRFFPKGMDMRNVHPNTVRSVQLKINNRPVKKFNYLTPLEKKLTLTNVALVG